MCVAALVFCVSAFGCFEMTWWDVELLAWLTLAWISFDVLGSAWLGLARAHVCVVIMCMYVRVCVCVCVYALYVCAHDSIFFFFVLINVLDCRMSSLKVCRFDNSTYTSLACN